MATVLVRRSQRARCAGRLYPLLYRWIPQPRVLHPYPDARFAATHPGKSRMRERARADLCGGRPAMVVPPRQSGGQYSHLRLAQSSARPNSVFTGASSRE